MEKFSTWRDKGTGISPFMPPESAESFAFKFIVSPVLVCVKAPLFVLLYLATYIAPKPAIKLAFSWLLGIKDIDLLVEGIRKTKTEEINRHKPQLNDVVIVNLISPLDVFILFVVSAVNSLRQIVVVVSSPDGLMRFSVWEYVSFMFSDLDSRFPKDNKLSSFKELEGKMVIFFPEGTSTNNKAILPFIQIPESFLSIPGFSYKTIVLRMYPNILTLPVPHMTKSQYIRKLLSQREKTFVKVRIVPNEKASLNASKVIFAENGLNTVQLGLKEKKDFFTFYRSYTVSKLTK